MDQKTEDKIRKGDLFYRTLFEAAEDAIFVMREDRFIDCNPATLRMFGCARGDIVDQSPYRYSPPLQPDGRDSRDKALEKIGKAFAGEPQHFEWLHSRLDGSTFDAEVSLNRVELGNETLVLAIVRDVSERKRAEKALEASQEEARRMEERVRHAQKLESLGVLAGGIAHDFNNLLMGIIGNTEMALRTPPESPRHRDMLYDVMAAAERAADLSKQMLAYSGKGRFEVTALDMNELVREMAHLLEVSVSKMAPVRYELAASLPAVEADATQLRQIVMNLITNASEAIGEHEGTITLRTGAMECDRRYLARTQSEDGLAEGVYVFVEVADTGLGMDQHTRRRVFEPFFTTKFTGRGLGLSAVLGIVKAHRGAIKVDTAPGEGSTFRILLPAVARPADRLDSESDTSVGAGVDPRDGGAVLVVDDEDTVRAPARLMLEQLGFTVVSAADGNDALRLFGERPEDFLFVLLDRTMPHMNGEETFTRLREIDPGVRVIMMSGYDEHEIATNFESAGPSGFIQKPFKLADLASRIRSLPKR
ncbi:MAG: response regulator [Deltaproteobacteria bacterium]|nr:response regulator [Deltaproteobacteria bacterium]